MQAFFVTAVIALILNNTHQNEHMDFFNAEIKCADDNQQSSVK